MTHDYLLKRLFYDPETGLFFWRERDVKRIQDKTWNRKWSGKETGYIRHNGYKVINLDGKEYPCSRLAWFYVKGSMPTKEIDHINGVKIDNRISNLREATRSQNAINKPKNKNNSCGYKGVHHRTKNCFEARIKKDGKNYSLGHFKTAQAAHEAYKKAAVELFGEFARVS